MDSPVIIRPIWTMLSNSAAAAVSWTARSRTRFMTN